jgi:hypothetical protein
MAASRSAATPIPGCHRHRRTESSLTFAGRTRTANRLAPLCRSLTPSSGSGEILPGLYADGPEQRVVSVAAPADASGDGRRAALCRNHEVPRWRWADRRGTSPPRAGAAGRGRDDRDRSQRPGGREAVPGVADAGEPVAAVPGRRRPGSAGLQGRRRRPVQTHPGPGRRARGGARRRPGGVRVCMRISAGRWPGSPSRCGGGPGWSTRWPGWMCYCTGPGGACRSRRDGRPSGRGEDCQVAGGDLARHKRTAADLGAWLCFQDESGQGRA